MSTKKTSRKGQLKNNKGRLADKSMSFHGRGAEEMAGMLQRPRTLPDLYTARVTAAGVSTETMTRPKLTKLLLKVTVQRSLGPVQVLMSPESNVGELIAAVLRQYSKEGRRPLFPSLDPSGFGLHYSQFSLEGLKTEEKLIELGSRNFFLCPKQPTTTVQSYGGADEVELGYGVMTSSPPRSSTCSKEADKVTKGRRGWLNFMEFML